MEQAAYAQYERESSGWLHRGRAAALDSLMRLAASSGRVEHVLEVGAGVGQNVAVLERYGTVDVGEIDEIGLTRLKELPAIGHIYTDRIPFVLRREYDVICALDVVEHLEDDAGALAWMAQGVRPGGFIIIAVPAYQWLFSDHDRALGHYRRYTRRALRAVLPPEMVVVRAGYFNTCLFPLVAASRLAGRALRKVRRAPAGEPHKQSSSMPAAVDRLFGNLLGLEARALGRFGGAPFGLSVVLLAQRPLTS